jgi:hypothetical protein
MAGEPKRPEELLNQVQALQTVPNAIHTTVTLEEVLLGVGTKEAKRRAMPLGQVGQLKTNSSLTITFRPATTQEATVAHKREGTPLLPTKIVTATTDRPTIRITTAGNR